MPDRALWALMQRIETLRHRADRLERAAAHWPLPWRDVALRIAGRWRQVANEMYAPSSRRRRLERSGNGGIPADG